MGCQVSVEAPAVRSFGSAPRSGIAGSHDNSVVTAHSGCSVTSHSSVQGSGPPTPFPTLAMCFSWFFVCFRMTFLLAVKWYLLVVFFLMTDILKHPGPLLCGGPLCRDFSACCLKAEFYVSIFFPDAADLSVHTILVCSITGPKVPPDVCSESPSPP